MVVYVWLSCSVLVCFGGCEQSTCQINEHRIFNMLPLRRGDGCARVCPTLRLLLQRPSLTRGTQLRVWFMLCVVQRAVPPAGRCGSSAYSFNRLLSAPRTSASTCQWYWHGHQRLCQVRVRMFVPPSIHQPAWCSSLTARHVQPTCSKGCNSQRARAQVRGHHLAELLR